LLIKSANKRAIQAASIMAKKRQPVQLFTMQRHIRSIPMLLLW